MKDFYKILGVDEKAKKEEIRKAYRSLARKFHPDKNPDDPSAEQRFKEIQEAYEILGDEKKRAEYDNIRNNPFGSGSYGDFFSTGSGSRFYRAPDGTYVRTEFGEGAGGDPSDLFGDGLGDIFSRFFGSRESGGRGTRVRTERPPQNVDTSIRLSFEQALKGGKARVTVPDGETIQLKIPKGVHDGYRIRIKGKGGAAGSSRGDLYVTFHVEDHPDFRRAGDDLYTAVPISAIEAMVGTEKSITNAYGERVKLKIPSGIQPGEKLRLRGQGVKKEDRTGDLYAEIAVTIPDNLTEVQRRALADLAKKQNLI